MGNWSKPFVPVAKQTVMMENMWWKQLITSGWARREGTGGVRGGGDVGLCVSVSPSRTYYCWTRRITCKPQLSSVLPCPQ